MELADQKMVLERFLLLHGIELPVSARLAHYGRRFSAYFPQIAASVNPLAKPWTARAVKDLAEHVRSLDPKKFEKSANAAAPKVLRRLHQQNRTRAFLFSREWRELRFDVLRQYGAQCQLCGAKSGEQRIEVDHISPISKHWERRLDRTNLQVLCRPCNKGKGSRVTADFR